MDDRSSVLGEIAAEAAMERTTFLVDAGQQLTRFVDANKRRIHEAGGLVLIDDDPDYLSVAPDGTFRSRTRYQGRGHRGVATRKRRSSRAPPSSSSCTTRLRSSPPLPRLLASRPAAA
jgi:hypothetical protein